MAHACYPKNPGGNSPPVSHFVCLGILTCLWTVVFQRETVWLKGSYYCEICIICWVLSLGAFALKTKITTRSLLCIWLVFTFMDVN